MLISELFYSVQGEGSLLGMPSIFIRSSGCNLRCRWCDTPYASWRPEGTEMTPSQIMQYVEEQPQCRHVVLTGGEPMVAKGVQELLSLLHQAGLHITVETAGTISPHGIHCDLASISPKLAHSTPLPGEAEEAWRKRHESTRWQPDILRQWLAGPWQVQLKFVIATEADVQEMRLALQELAPDLAPEKVLLMPEGIHPSTLSSRYPLIIDACKTYGYRYSPRAHIDLFGNKRGT